MGVVLLFYHMNSNVKEHLENEEKQAMISTQCLGVKPTLAIVAEMFKENDMEIPSVLDTDKIYIKAMTRYGADCLGDFAKFNWNSITDGTVKVATSDILPDDKDEGDMSTDDPDDPESDNYGDDSNDEM